MATGFDHLQALAATAGFVCARKQQLTTDFTSALRELVQLQSEQIQAVIRNDADFARYDLSIQMAAERKREAKYALLAHMEAHKC